jgi:RHS repeat-associated protein
LLAAFALAAPARALVTEQITSDTAMNALISAHVFVAEGRNNRALNGTFELDLGQNTSAPAVTKQYVWPNGTAVPFTLSFNGTTATLQAGGHTLAYVATGTIEEIFVRTRATVANTSILVDQLVLNGEAVGDVSQAVNASGGLGILRIAGFALTPGFTLTGRARMSWGSTAPTNSNLAFQVKVVDAVSGPAPPTVDLVSPANGALLATGSVGVSGTVSAGATVSVNGQAATVSGTSWSTTLALADGTHVLTATATNAAGTATDTATVTVDTTAPQVTIVAPAAGALTNQTLLPVTGTVTDASPVTSVSIDGTSFPVTAGSFSGTAALAEGANTITVTAQDAAGNVGPASVAVTRDTIAPLLTVDAPPDGPVTLLASVTASGTASDANGVAQVSVNGASAALSAGAFSLAVPLALGTNVIEVVATDAAGNASAVMRSVTRGNLPAVAITSPADGAFANATQVVVLGTASDASGVAVNGVAATLAGGDWSALVPLAPGANSLTAVATNAFGQAQDEITVTLDTAGPTLAVTGPADGAFVAASPITVAGSVSDPSGVASVLVNGQPASVAGGAFSLSLALVEGSNAITVTARDGAGNETTTSLAVVLDGTPPSLAIESPPNGATVGQQALVVSGTASDANGVASVTVNGAAATVSGASWSANVTLAAGANTLSVVATDAAGNATAASVSVSFVSTPEIVSTPVGTATEDQPYSYDVEAIDPNPAETLSYALGAAPAGMTIDAGSGLISWTPTGEQVGGHFVLVTVTNQALRLTSQVFPIEVASTNDGPVFTSQPVVAAEPAVAYRYDAAASDPDLGDPVSFSLDEAPAGMSVSASSGIVTWTPGAGDLGPHPVTLRASDGGGLFATQSFTLEVSTLPPLVARPSLGANLALGPGGATATASSVSTSTSLALANVFDGNGSTAFATATGQVANQWLRFDLTGDLSVIDRVVLQGTNQTTDPRSFEIRVSTTGSAESDFTTVFAGAQPRSDVAQEHAFPPVQARYVELRILDNHGSTQQIRIAEFEAHTRDREGAIVSLGGTAIGASSQSSTSTGPDKAIDLSETSQWNSATGQIANQWLKFELAESTTIDRVRLLGLAGTLAAKDFEVAVSNTGTDDADFAPVVAGQLRNVAVAQWFHFPEVPARYVRLALLNNWGSTQRIVLGDFRVFSSTQGGEQVPFDDLTDDPADPPVAFHWDFGDGAMSSERHPVHTYAAPGTYVVTFTATRASGVVRSVSRSYTVLPRPVVDFTWSFADPREQEDQVFFTSRSTSPNGAIVTTVWNHPHDPFFSSSSSIRYPDNGVFTADLTVTDDHLLSSSGSKLVTVINSNPDANAGADARALWNEPVTLASSVGDPSNVDATSLVCTWDFGDGTSTTIAGCASATSQVAHAYSAIGNYTATLTVRDKDGGLATDTAAVIVGKRPASLVVLGASAVSGNSVSVDLRLFDAYSDQESVAGRTLEVGFGGQLHTVTTDASGRATLALPFVPGAPNPVSARFAGDAFYLAAAGAGVFSPAASGELPVLGAPSAPDNAGREYFLTFQTNYEEDAIPTEFDLLVTSRVETVATVEAPGIGFGPFNYPVRPGEFTTIALPTALETIGSGRIEDKGVRVSAPHELIVYGANRQAFSTDAFLGLPKEALGTDHVIPGYAPASGSFLPRPGRFSVVATEDATQVTITPSAPFEAGPDTPSNLPAGVPFTVTLDRLQVLQLETPPSTLSFRPDVTGTRVGASRPVFVLAGNQCLNILGGFACDILLEQVPPVHTLGREFLTIPFAGTTDTDQPHGALVRVVAAHDATDVLLNGTLVASLDRGEHLEHDMAAGTEVQLETSQPALAYQIMKSAGAPPQATGNSGDPAMMLLVPTEQFAARHLVTPLQRSEAQQFEHHLTLIAPTTEVAGIRLDGQPLTSPAWRPIGTSGYSGIQVPVAAGRPHDVRHLSPAVAFGVYAYGQLTYDSYAYTGSTRLVDTTACTPSTALPGDGLDNDCDGRVDEELGNALDEDGDSLVDEDLALGGVGVNVAPEAFDTSRATDEDLPVRVVLPGFDANGDHLSYSVVTPPAHGTVSITGAVALYTPAANYFGPDSFTFRVNDGALDSAAATASLTVLSLDDAPRITTTPVTSATQGVLYDRSFVATDPDPGSVLSWSLVNAPAGMGIVPGTGRITWTPTAAQVGRADVVVRVTDATGLSDSKAYAINVQNVNDPPSITSSAPAAGTITVPYVYDVESSDPDANDPPAFSLTAAPAGMTIDAKTGRITWTPAAGQEGPRSATVRVTDLAGLFATQTFTVTVAADTTAPLVSIGASPLRFQPGDQTLLTVTATDAAPIAGLTLSVDGVPLALDAEGQAYFTSTTPGAHSVLATATDASGNVGTGTTVVGVSDAADTTPPVVAITAPAELAELTFLHDVAGTATDDNLLRYELSLIRVNETAGRTLATGTTPVTAAPLAQLDTTLLENGLYQLRLFAEDVNGRSASVDHAVRIDGGAKVGIFQLAFVDLQVPMAGIPIAVVRSYDSRVKSKRDFGVGWDLDVSAGEIQQKHPFHDGWVIATDDDPFSLPCGIVLDQEAHATEIRLSERERYVFRPTLMNALPLSGGCRADVGFELVDGTTPGAELFVVGPTGVRAPGAVVHGPNDPLPNGTLVSEDTGLPFQPTQLQLRTADGRIFDLTAGVGIRRIEDRNGNELFINSNGIVHSGGTSIAFVRDGQGRITRITDPNGAARNYAYDAAGDLVSFTDPVGSTTSFAYDDDHQLVEITAPDGVVAAQPEYDAQGRLIAVIDAAGNRISLFHDVGGRIETREDRLGFDETFEYDERGNVVRQVDREGQTWTYAYDADDNQTSATDPTGATTTRTFDTSHRPLTETNPLGDTRSWTYNAAGDVLSETDFDGRVTTNTYDARGNPLTTTAPDGTVTSFVHDAQGNLRSLTNPEGETVQAAYNVEGRLVSTTDPTGHVTSYTYDANGNALTSTETRTTAAGTPQTLITRFAYDLAGRLSSTTDPLGGVSTTEYDANGRVVAQEDALGRRSETVYDGLGRAIEEIAPDGTSRQTVYDAEDQVVAQVDEAGRTTQLFYDAAGRAIETRYPDGTSSLSTYDGAGRLVRIRDRRGFETEFEYDDAGRQTLVRDALGGETTTAYDEAGRRTSQTDANGHTTLFAYDAAGRLTTTTHPDGTTSQTLYDLAGRVIAEIDPAGARTDFGYDDAGRLAFVLDAAGGTTSFEYDELGNRTAMVDALGRRRLYEFDGLGRETAEEKPLGERNAKVYDATGQLTQSTDFLSRPTTRIYDALGRLASETDADGTTAYAYTLTGQLSQVTDPLGTTSYAYDVNDRLAQVVRPGGQTLSYTYDPEGNRTSVTAPSGTTSYAFDPLGRVTSITDPAGATTSFAYDAAGNPTSRTQPNGVTTTYTRDLRDRLTTIESRTASNTLLARYAYTLDLAGNHTQVLEHTGRRVSWQYDALYRLLSETIEDPGEPPATEGFAYDAVGNRVLHATAGGVFTPSYDANDRLLSDGTATYTWDANGNLASRSDASGTTTYAFDARDRLVEVDGPSSGLVEHVYDFAGDRVETRVGGVATTYLVDANRGLSQVVEERDGLGGLLAAYVHGDAGEPLARIPAAGPDPAYFLHDGQGSVRQLADPVAAITDAYSYSAFGATLASTGATPNPYRYGGQWEEASSGLYHLRARWMDPRVGRFVSTDPFAGFDLDPASLHRFAYANLNPINRFDPTGRFTITDQAFVTAISAGLVNLGFSVAFSGGNLTGRQAFTSFAVGAITAPVGGAALRVLGPMLRPLTTRALQAVGRMMPLSLAGKAGWERVLIKMSRVLVNTNRHYPRIGDTSLGRFLQRYVPQIEWQNHHVFIQQAWMKAGKSQLYTNVLANEGLRRIGNGLWNLLPIPAELNRWFYRSPMAAQVFATIYYSALAFSPFHVANFVSSLDAGDE